VLLVPNTALRFEPPATDAKEKKSNGGLVSSLFGRRPPGADQKRKETTENARQRRVWVLQDGRPQSISVQIGATDGKFTQVIKGDLTAGVEVLIDTITASK
jgi:HlyD family secretion protein